MSYRFLSICLCSFFLASCGSGSSSNASVPELCIECPGVVVTSFGEGVYQRASLIQQDDGKLVLLSTMLNEETGNEIGLARFNLDGSYDETFGEAGEQTFYDGVGVISADLVQMASGKLVVVGNIFMPYGVLPLSLRYNADGSIDTSFGPMENGVVIIASSGAETPNNLMSSVVEIDAGGTMQVGQLTIKHPETDVETDNNFFLIRLDADGELDYSSELKGTLKFPPTLSGDVHPLEYVGRGLDVAKQSDGQLVYVALHKLGDQVVFRMGQNGVWDESFGSEGLLSSSFAQKVIVQPDGKIVLLGYEDSGETDDFVIARYMPDGSIDESFGELGMLVLDTEFDDRAFAGVLQQDGKIVVVGYVSSEVGKDIALARVNADGTPDKTFGGASGLNNGAIISSLSEGDDFAVDIVQQQDGKLVIAALSELDTSGDFQVVLVRFNENGVLDTSFQGTESEPAP